MNPWPRRTAYLLVFLTWLFCMSLPLLAFSLAAKTQLQVGAEGGSTIRVFLVQEALAEGIGIETSRVDAADHPGCAQIDVRYLLWKGVPENASYCQCVDEETGYAAPVSAAACGLD